MISRFSGCYGSAQDSGEFRWHHTWTSRIADHSVGSFHDILPCEVCSSETDAAERGGHVGAARKIGDAIFFHRLDSQISKLLTSAMRVDDASTWFASNH